MAAINFKEKVSDTSNKGHFALPSKFPLQVAPFTLTWFPTTSGCLTLKENSADYVQCTWMFQKASWGVRQGTTSDAQGILLILHQELLLTVLGGLYRMPGIELRLHARQALTCCSIILTPNLVPLILKPRLLYLQIYICLLREREMWSI